MGSKWYDYPVSHGYITSYQGSGTDTPHFAEDLATPFHTQLTAPTAGTVVKADYQSWGGEIFVQPDDKSLPEWYMYHPDQLEVQTGQHVQAGQAIALSGGENPGYPGAEHPAATQWSTGPHTHIGWWTKWIDTPNGVAPYGPDPSNLIEMAAHGGGGSSSLVPGNVYSAVEPYAQAQHVPDPLWETVAYMESAFNPTATNSSSGNPAVGLFQLLENVGQGAGYSTSQLQDPSTNARIGMASIGSAWQKLGPSFDANSLQWWEQFAAVSGHPGGAPGQAYTDQVAQQMMTDYKQFANGGTATLSDTSNTTANCVPPAWNDLAGWPGYWACQAQSAAAGSAQSAAAGIAGWIGASIGPFMLRAGVGLVGAFLIYIGTNDIVAALRGESWQQMSQDETRAIPVVGDKVADEEQKVEKAAVGEPKAEKKEGKPKAEKKESESKPEKKESKPKAEKKEGKPKAEKPAAAKASESAGEGAKAGEGIGEAATTAAEVAV
jgi:hypothetical protein